MAKPIYEPKYGFYKDPLTDRTICMNCYEGMHTVCIHGDCRCLHNFAERRRKPKKDDSTQTDMSGFGTINV